MLPSKINAAETTIELTNLEHRQLKNLIRIVILHHRQHLLPMRWWSLPTITVLIPADKHNYRGQFNILDAYICGYCLCLIKGGVVLLQILIMLITYIFIIFNKLHHKKSKLLKLKQEEDNKDVLKNFLHRKREM
jgi:hypothetical protein